MATDGLGKLRLGVGALALMGLGAGAVTLVPSGSGAGDVPQATMALEPLPTADLSAISDGYGHFLVEVPEAGAATATPPGDDSSEDSTRTTNAQPAVVTTPAAVDADGQPPAIGIDDLEHLDTEIDRLEGDGETELIAVLSDGRRIPVVVGDEAVAAPVTPLPPAPTAVAVIDGMAALDALRAAPSTVAVEPVGGGWFAVTTELDEAGFTLLTAQLGLRSMPDVPAVITEEDEHRSLLWALDNPGGMSYAGVVGVEDVDVDGVEATSAQRGAGVVVAVIDSGADTGHPDLPPFWVNTDEECGNGIDDDANGYIDDCEGWDFFNNDNTPFDADVDSSHGTHVTGTIAAVPDNGIGVAGLAPGVTVMNIKALQQGSTWTSTLARAIYYAVDNGASVINASFGSSGATMEQIPGLTAAVSYAEENGVIIVAAAGNSGADIGVQPTFPAAYPHDNVITVGADTADGRAASFSNRGDAEVDLHAPGHYIVSTVPGGYAAKQGTSMAAPHVTAAVALVQAHDPGAGIAGVRAAVLESIDRRAGLQGTSVTGGSLNAARAIGVEAPNERAPFEVTVHGLDRLRSDAPTELRVVSTVRDQAIAGDRPVVLRATILTAVDGVDYGLAGQSIDVNGGAATTDEHAQVILSSHQAAYAAELLGGTANTLRTTFEPGVYALAVEIVDAEDPDAAYGPAGVVFFEVPDTPVGTDPTPTTTTTAPPADDPAPTTIPAPPGPPTPGPTPAPTVPPSTVPVTTVPTPGAAPVPAPGTTPTTVPAVGTPPVPGTPPAGTPPVPGTPVPGTPPVGTPPVATPPVTTPPVTGPPVTGPPVTVPGTTPPTTPPTTAPPSTTPPTTAPLPPTVPDDGPVTRNGMTLLKVSPTWGRPEGGNIVVIHGRNLPSTPLVYFGGVPATVKRANSSSLLVEAPANDPGTYDVTVDDGTGFRLTLRLAYTYAAKKPKYGEPVTPGPAVPIPDPPTRLPEPTPLPTPTPVPAPSPAPPDPTGPPEAGPPETVPPETGPPTTRTPLPTPTGRPRVVLSGTPTDIAGGRAQRVVVNSPVDHAPGEWMAHACGRPACAADLHSVEP